MPLIVAAIERQMHARGDAQAQVAAVTGVNQGEISRVLAGHRRKVTRPVRELCKYANFNVDQEASFAQAEQQLSQAVRGVIGDNARAAQALTRILEALAPLLRDYHP